MSQKRSTKPTAGAVQGHRGEEKYLPKGRGRGRVNTRRRFGPTRSLAAPSAATSKVAKRSAEGSRKAVTAVLIRYEPASLPPPPRRRWRAAVHAHKNKLRLFWSWAVVWLIAADVNNHPCSL
eukprot:scaffold6164_cov50-Phaeocystis_antarctica.AAC.2